MFICISHIYLCVFVFVLHYFIVCLTNKHLTFMEINLKRDCNNWHMIIKGEINNYKGEGQIGIQMQINKERFIYHSWSSVFHETLLFTFLAKHFFLKMKFTSCVYVPYLPLTEQKFRKVLKHSIPLDKFLNIMNHGHLKSVILCNFFKYVYIDIFILSLDYLVPKYYDFLAL